MIKALVFAAIFAANLLGHVTSASTEHCSSDWFVHEITPSSQEVWRIGETRLITWRWGYACAPSGLFEVSVSRNGGDYELLAQVEGTTLTYDIPIEFSWLVSGPDNSSAVFQVRYSDPNGRPSFSAEVLISGTVGTTPTSWGTVKARF